jgi:SAM-dependent methyltransferase
VKKGADSPRGPHADAEQLREVIIRGPREETKSLSGVKAWWHTFFDDSYGRLGLEIIEEERTLREVDFIIDALKLKKQERVLDLACGMGRHALELVRRGFTGVTGLDYTESYLMKARELAQAEDLNVRFIQGDMRDIPFGAEEGEEGFDACYNYFTSFGFFENERDNEQVIASVARALKPGGRFLLETMHRDYTVRHFHPRSWMKYGDDYVLKKHQIDLASSALTGSWTFISRGKTISSDMRLRMYSLHEMIGMLKRNGLRFQEAWGNRDKEALTWHHHRMIVVARKEK